MHRKCLEYETRKVAGTFLAEFAESDGGFGVRAIRVQEAFFLGFIVPRARWGSIRTLRCL